MEARTIWASVSKADIGVGVRASIWERIAESLLRPGGERPAVGGPASMPLSVGDWVEVRSKEEILATLDKNGRLEEMPFMPQMFQYCGQRFQVHKRAHKTCDPNLLHRRAKAEQCRAPPIEV